MKRLTPYVFFIITTLFLSFGCHKEISKDSANNKELAQPNRISPGYAEITGQIVEILPIDNFRNEKDPCSKAPCKAKVKIENITYGPGFPTMSGSTIIFNFNFTLSPTSKDMFPGMEDSYPGLKVGDKFRAIAGFVSVVGKDQPEFFINGYTKI